MRVGSCDYCGKALNRASSVCSSGLELQFCSTECMADYLNGVPTDDVFDCLVDEVVAEAIRRVEEYQKRGKELE